MPTLLHLDSSADTEHSVSRALTARFAERWAAAGPGRDVVHRDLHIHPLPPLPTHVLHWAPRLRRPDEKVPADAEALQETLIGELLGADVVVIGAPMYNWSVPATLKAWIDYVHVPGTTAPLDEPTQPLAARPLVLVSSRGAGYGPDSGNVDHELPGLRQVFAASMGFDLHVVTAELTLASRLPFLAELVPAAQESLEAAGAHLDDLAVSLGPR
jgi:FMN-dependent NADH-azoreductase